MWYDMWRLLTGLTGVAAEKCLTILTVLVSWLEGTEKLFVLTLSVWRFLFDADQRLRSRTTSKLISSFREVFDGSKIVDRMEGTECGALSFRLCWQVTSKQGRHWSREGERGDLIGPRYAESTVVSLKDVIAETHSLVSLTQWNVIFQCFLQKKDRGVSIYWWEKSAICIVLGFIQ